MESRDVKHKQEIQKNMDFGKNAYTQNMVVHVFEVKIPFTGSSDLFTFNAGFSSGLPFYLFEVKDKAVEININLKTDKLKEWLDNEFVPTLQLINGNNQEVDSLNRFIQTTCDSAIDFRLKQLNNF